ncbi:MAG: NERD domain-containing protein [Actinomycetota bacterium]|nr:NERD domain-containing protein [Actinomycetota bacterium]
MTGRGHGATEGEEATAAALMALPPSWVVLDELDWPGRRFTNIDHVVIGPPGVFVIDTKNWSGRVVVENGVLAQSGHDRNTAVWGAAAAAASVSDLVPSLRPDYVHGVVCLADAESRVSWVDGVLVCPSSRLVDQLTRYAEVLPGGLASAIATDVGRRLGPADRPEPEQASNHNRRPLAAAVPIVLALAMGAALLPQPDMITSLLDDLAGLVR